MAYLYLNFSENMSKGLGDKSRDWNEFFTQSLNEQYDTLKKKLGVYAPENLQEFVVRMFPANFPKNYNISMPSFHRDMTATDNRGNKIIRNIVIRPESEGLATSVLPDTYDFIVIGDVRFGGVTAITVKGIDLIDRKIVKYGEKKVLCSALCAFAKKNLNNRGTVMSVPDYSNGELHAPVLTNDFVKEIAENLYPVPNQMEALTTLTNWKNYLKFREYYLAKQSERCEEISNVHVCDAYIVTKKSYYKNEETFSKLLLDGMEDFRKGEQVVLSKNVEGADNFPLICVTIEKNRRKVLSETFGKKGRGKPKYEVGLNRYTRDAMGLSPYPPRADDKGNIRNSKAYLLGERYLFTHVDVEPDLAAVHKRYEESLSEGYRAIESRHSDIIFSELDRYVKNKAPAVADKYDRLLEEYRLELESKLDSDVQNNTDKEVNEAYQNEINKVAESLGAEKQQKHKFFRANKDSELSAEEIDAIKSQISLRDFYVRRNMALVEKKKKSLDIRHREELEKLKKDKKAQLEFQHKDSIASEKNEIEAQLSEDLDEEKKQKIKNETIRRYHIYFRSGDVNDRISEIKKQIETAKPKYLTYENYAEKAKIDRQKKALSSIEDGYVRNPFLPTCLFAPEVLAQSSIDDGRDIKWCLESLNDMQKLAVKRAIQSESLFLLQGPPGTGKTQVIAEITAQLAKRGKKILISSETHKAIDNVFERLPKIPEIRPLRLIPSQNGKETNYSPSRLVDNLYLNICGNLEKKITRVENFEETREEFDNTMRSLRNDYDRILKLSSENATINLERQKLHSEISSLKRETEGIREKLRLVKEKTERYNRTVKYIESYRFSFSGEEVDEDCMKKYSDEVEKLLMRFACLNEITLDKVGDLANADIRAIEEEATRFLEDDPLLSLGKRQEQLRSVLRRLCDPYTEEAPEEGDEKFEEYKKNQKELIEVSKEIKACKSVSDFNIFEGLIYTLVPNIVDSPELLKQLPKELALFQANLADIVKTQKEIAEAAIAICFEEENSIKVRINEQDLTISEKNRLHEDLGKKSGVEEYEDLNSKLKQKITRFFYDFEINREYNSDNLEEAFDIIKEEWKKLEIDYNASSVENKVKIPMYKDIVKYLSKQIDLEDDRAAYTRELYNSVNVFGITCTSRDRFTKSQLAELEKYGIDSVDIRTQGIDVVIVDEVSKSSFLDLLIPILYGKTIILVGDHRQLPPMYDLRHMRDEDFEGLSEDIITKEINAEYMKLYEECFFKRLYERVPNDFRVMLNKQYRCHSHIMEVFNHFYGGNGEGLFVGKKQQDDEKEHNLTVKINGSTIIDPKRHIYFIDCDQKESSAFEGSTSKINDQEAQVAIVLLKELDKAAKELMAQQKVVVDSTKKIDERPSAGIICTYGDQARLIKKKKSNFRFEGFSEKQDERLVISTVDDFQGDERDIIIVSMVRNPSNSRYDAEFVKKFERINVALSRARKLLIIVGSKKFLSEAGIIDLPDLKGDRSKDKINFPVYREIIDTISFRGRILNAQEILGE